ncbi:MAG: hypothetical protein WCA32_04905 [Chromatiaceae bacterium]|jgi:hypothetical protein
MFYTVRHWHLREFRFLSLVVLIGFVIALHLGAGLQAVGQEGSGWRSVDAAALQRRIESGELRDREANWYHSATDVETTHVRGER